MDLSRHKGSAYQSEGSNAEAVAELSASRRNLVDLSGSGKGGNSFYAKSFKRGSKKEEEDVDPADNANLSGSEHAQEEQTA